MALEGLKNAYFKAEDKWYAATERIGLSGLVDRIDKVVPSFALFLFIVVVLLIAGFFMLPGIMPSGAVFSFKAIDEDGAAISNVTVTVLAADGTQLASEKTGPSGETKQITLPIGKEIEIKAEKEGWQQFKKTITVSTSMLPYEITLASAEEVTYTISLKDSLGQPVREAVTLTFQCRNSAIQPWSETVSSGSTTVTEPANCNGLVASVTSSNFQPVESVSITQQNQSIFLLAITGDKATINVELLFNGQMVSEAVSVHLFKDNGTDAGIGPVETAVSENGRAVFLADAGKYFVKSSSYGSFAATKSQAFTIAAGGQQTVQLPLQKNIVGTIRLSIIDEKTGKAVGDATVFLRLGSEEIDSKETSLDNNALVEFPVTQDTTYTAVVDHGKYCLKVLNDVKIEGITRQVKLKPFTAECGGTLKVKVLDQDGRLVKGATVGLYTEEGFSAGFTTKTTDLNGIASFERVPSGTYKAFAFKGTVGNWSEPANFVQRTAEKTILTVVLNVANGTLSVKVVDDEGTPLQFAHVTFVDAITNEPTCDKLKEPTCTGTMIVEDINGIVELATRADKKVYIVATKDGYANFTSIAKPVLPEGTQQFTAILPKKIIQGEVQIELKGIFKNGKSISVLAPGEKYDALFNVRIPANKGYDRIGMHVRTGTHNAMELDKIVLKEINVGGKTAIIMATTYSQTEGYAIDSQHLSTDEGKWANIEWLENTTGIIEVAATVRVKETATSEDELLLFYRTWGIANSAYKRDPLDNDLGEAESIAGKDALYANAKQNTFQVGAESQCDELFCFSANILDVAENLTTSATDSFNAKAFKAYKLGFTVLNNSKHETDTYIDAELKIANEDEMLLMQDYKIYGAQSQMVEGMTEGASTEWVEVGNIQLNNTVNGTLNFTPQKSGSALLSVQIRSGNMIRFDKKIAINIAAEKEMNVVIAPETLPSGMETDLTVTAKDKKTGAEINEALVKVKDRFGTVVVHKFTNRMGIAVLRLPQLQPGEIVQLIVGKPNYVTFEKALQVDSKVIAVKPATIGVALNPKTKVEADSAFDIENKTAFDLQIKGIRLSGKTLGLIDVEKVNNWLFGYVNETIKSDEIKDLHLKTMLSEKGKKTSQSQQIEATLDITVAAGGSEWEQQVPVKISIGLGGETDDPGCFTVTRKEWKGSTEGNPIEIEFELQNNCSIEGAPVALKNISGRIEWHSNQAGTFSVRTENSAMEIRSGYNKQFLATIEKEQSISVVLQFTPDAGVNGKGIADIVFQAENPTDTTTQELTDKIAAEITVVNLVDCIAFSKDVIVIKPEKTDSFDIETINCGPVNEIRLESDLTVSTSNFKLGSKESKKIEVLAEKNIPGQYPIKVFAKGTDQVQFKLIKTIRARILSDKCFELSRYEFDVFDNPDNPYDGYDTAELINNCYDKQLQITVKYDEKDLMEAAKTGALVGLGMGLLGGLLGGQTDAATAQTAATGAATAAAPVSPSTGGAATGGTRVIGSGGTTAMPAGAPATGATGGAAVAGTTAASGTRVISPSQVTYDLSGGGTATGTYITVNGQSQLIDGYGNKVAVYTEQPKGVLDYLQVWNWGQPKMGWEAVPSYSVNNSTTGIDRANPAPSAAITSSPTGFASMFGGDSGGLGGGLLGNLVMGAGSAILGKPSFAGWGIQGFMIGTLMAYNNQESGTFTFPTIQKDVIFKGIQLLMPGATLEENKLVETPSTDIIARDLEETSTEPKPEDKRLSTEIRKIGFLNTTGVVQPDPATPLFRVLKVDAERVEYQTEYDTKENKTPKIKVKERKENKERFRLQFNSFNPLLVEPEMRPIPNCKLGTVVGVTGPSAVPKVSFNWDWGSIAEDACVEGNPNYVYCDATQFSIVVLKKLQRLQQFIEEQKPFDCPTAATAGAVKEQPLLGTAYDVAITKVQANKAGTEDANIVVSIESNNGVRMDAELRIDLSNAATGELAKSCTRVLSVLSKTIENCEFKNLGEGQYKVRASVSATLCPTCENSSPENDSIEAVLAIGSAGVAECDPFNTKRLPLFIEATEAAGNSGWNAQQREQILKTIKFNAFLMQDAFTDDFRKDFDMFCKQQSFFDCPEYYLEETGLHKFFADQDRFKFDYSMAPHAPADAGKYTVTINIEFDNKNWDLFSANEPSAKISIEMVKLSTPEPDSPFYYIPFDGLIGIDSMDGRQGYGINFRQTSEETIKINNSREQPIVSSTIANSTPVLDGWIEAGRNDSFRRLNLDSRGILLDVSAAADSTKVTLSPSYATPVIMQVDYEKGEHAYGFYSIEVDTAEQIIGEETIGGSPQAAFSKMIAWSGIGPVCRDFGDRPVMEAWQDTWDEHGGITGNQQCAIGTDITDYGIEWCNPIRKGSVFLEGVIFTPQNSTSLMKRATYSDNMTLISAGNKGSQIALNGVPGMAFNSFGANGIDSLEDVLELVKDNKVCLIGQGNRISAKFFWNPKAVLEVLAAERDKAAEKCIKIKQ